MIATETQLRQSTALGPGNFRKVAVNGIGDPHNAYVYSAVWYDNHLYVGTFRNALVLIKLRSPFEVQLPFWPVPVPESVWEVDLRAQIWRYSPSEDRWERVYRSTMIKGREGFDVPLSVGFRNMAVFQGKSDPHPCIYTVTFSSSQGYGPVVLRSDDGLEFKQVSEPSLGLGDQNLRSFRGVRPFKGKLFATPAGSGGGQVNVSYNVAILCSDDPAAGNWQMSNEPAFGDPTNLTVFEMAEFNDHLYATTLNTRHGFQVWKTDGEGPPPHRWTKVLDRGADRGPLNQAICGLCEFNGALYMGTGIQGGGIDRQNGIGPAAAELIRIYPDDSWDLVVGQPRITRKGPVFPSSGKGPGFDNFFAGYFWRMCQHDGAIYVGTYDWSTFLAYTPRDQWPESLKHLLTTNEIDRIVEARGGADLWRSTDGDRWVPVTTNGMGNRFNYGIRTLISTPAGLFVGTANPFGARVAVKKEGGYTYENNPLGGIEIWHGTPDHVGGVGDGAGTIGHEGQPHWLRSDGTSPVDASDVNALGAAPVVTFSQAGDLQSARVTSLPIPESDAPSQPTSRVSYSVRDIRDPGVDPINDPLVELATARRDLLLPCETIADEVAEYYRGSPLRCVGYWQSESSSPGRSSVDLLDQMTSLLNGHAAYANDGSLSREPVDALLLIADATQRAAQELQRLGAGREITITPPPASQRALRKPPKGGPFDAVFWIEGPSALLDRKKALASVRRWLKPGGQLVAADLLGYPLEQPKQWTDTTSSASQLMTQYSQCLAEAGFEKPRVFDVSAKCWIRFFRHSRRYFLLKQMFRLIDEERGRQVLEALPGGKLAVDGYFLFHATNPME